MPHTIPRKSRHSKLTEHNQGFHDNASFNKTAALDVLNHILEHELAGVLLYSRSALVVFGPQRRSLVQWMNEQANEALQHARKVGELITHYGELPSLGLAATPESHELELEPLLRRLLNHEIVTLELYRHLLSIAKDGSVLLEEFARTMVQTEELHAGEVEKMLRPAEHPAHA
jgi:bacterioferritin